MSREARPGAKMDTKHERMVGRAKAPTLKDVAAWVGAKSFRYWQQIQHFIGKNYPGVFKPEWLNGGKHGWYLRYKKSKSFCSLVPERNRLIVLIVFGKDERTKAEAMLGQLSPRARSDYEKAPTYHDGKWMVTAADSRQVVSDIERLLAVKRKPRQRKTV